MNKETLRDRWASVALRAEIPVRWRALEEDEGGIDV